MTSTTSSPPARHRNPVLVVIDILASVILLILGGAIALTVITYALAFGGFQVECGTGPYDGIVCNPVVLNIVVYGLLAITIIAFFLGLGMVIVNIIRKKITFFWPLGAIILTLLFFYLGAWIAGMTVPTA